ncbi:MAG: CCA tRNA nucleotidyltransferase [Planktomarina sp.]|nr:CCA tRNA nucleotidyltransferase [Planktomarina sp.]
MKIDTAVLDQVKLAPIFSGFERAGFKLFYVGGCVRNVVMAANATDIDLATDATTLQMCEIAAALDVRVIPTGEAHGTLTFQLGKQGYEITTFRQDIRTDGRHATVAFGTSIEVDAARRDFTMNALYADVMGNLIDPLGGLEDAKSHRIRFIGDAGNRIAEDYLRILRFFRFWAWYGDPDQGINPEGLAASAELQSGLDMISKERIGSELLKMLSAPNPAPALSAMAATGILARILPGATARDLALLVEAEQGLTPDGLRRLALLGGEAPQAHLRLSNAAAKHVEQLRYYGQNSELALAHGFALGDEHGWSSWLLRSVWLENMPAPEDRQAVSVGALATCPVKAEDLKGLFEGPALGVALRQAQEAWLASHMQFEKFELITQLRMSRG